MKLSAIALGLAAAVLVQVPANAETNVALNGTVTATGSGFGDWSAQWGSGSLSSLATVTDGKFLPAQQQWNIGTVFWNGTSNGDASNFVTIALNAPATITHFALQADNNDDYLIQYLGAGNTWQNLVTIAPNRSWGMEMGYASLASPVTASAFRIRSAAGDGYYSISEFQAFGTIAAVPEPEMAGMLLGGLGLMIAAMRRRKQRTC